MDEIEKDSKLDRDNLDNEALKIPGLHSKYYRYFVDSIRTLRAHEQILKDVRRFRGDYFLGKCDDDVYREEPLNFKVLKADLEIYLDSDSKYAQALAKRDEARLKVQVLEDFIKTLNNRSFLISNALNYMKFKAGVG